MGVCQQISTRSFQLAEGCADFGISPTGFIGFIVEVPTSAYWGLCVGAAAFLLVANCLARRSPLLLIGLNSLFATIAIGVWIAFALAFLGLCTSWGKAA